MLEHIGLLTYLFTRLDYIGASGAIMFIFGIFIFVGAKLIYHINMPVHHDRETKRELLAEYTNDNAKSYSRYVRLGIFMIIVGIIIKVFIPTKDDALLIAGVVVGTDVAAKTVAAVGKAEITGKVFEIVELKVDEVLREMTRKTGDKQPEKSGQ